MLSTSPVVSRFIAPSGDYLNPGSEPSNIYVYQETVIHPPVPKGFKTLNNVINKHESIPSRAEAMKKARQRLGEILVESNSPDLATLRLKAGFSQAKLAEALGNSQPSYSLIELGRRDILHSTFEKLVGLLGVTRDNLAVALKNSKERADR